jgi:hypothetical protein
VNIRARRRFGRRAEQGQVIPIVALTVLVITGFAAISLDAGMDYAQSRSDNDISDAAALTGAYWVVDNQSTTAGLTLVGLYTAEYNAASADGCNTGQCKGPAVTSGTSTYLVAEVWITNKFNPTLYPSPNIYVGSAGTCSTSSGGTFAVGTCPATSAILDVGAPVSDKTTDYFAAVVGGHPVGITPNAVAEVGGSGGGTTPTSPQLACEICVLQNVTLGSSSPDTLQATAGSIDIGGYVDARNSGSDTIQTSNGYGIDVIGGNQDSGNTLYFADSSGATVNAGSGSLGINGNVTNTSGGVVTLETSAGVSAFNITGSVTGNVTESPSSPGKTAMAAFKDPYAAAPTPLPTYTGSGSAWLSSVNASCASSETVPAGVYTSITTNCSGPVTLTLSGQYVLTGSTGLDLGGSGSVTLSGSATFYLTCGSGGCGGWTASPTPTCAATASGAQVLFNDSSQITVNLTAYEDGVLFYFDPCNSNPYAFYLESSGQVTDSGTGGIWAHSGVMYLGSATTMSLPGPIVVSTIDLMGSGGGTLGTTSGSISFTPSSSSAPGNLVK